MDSLYNIASICVRCGVARVPGTWYGVRDTSKYALPRASNSTVWHIHNLTSTRAATLFPERLPDSVESSQQIILPITSVTIKCNS